MKNVKIFHAPAVYRTWAKTGYLFNNGWCFCEYLFYMKPTLYFKKLKFNDEIQFENAEFPNFEGYQPFSEVKGTACIDFVEFVEKLRKKGLFDENADSFNELKSDLEKEIQRKGEFTHNEIDNQKLNNDTLRIEESISLSESKKNNEEYSLRYIEIENFRNIEFCQKFNVSPITLVTGKNNSGKSSVLKAFLILGHLSFDEEISQYAISGYDNFSSPLYNLDFDSINNQESDSDIISISVNLNQLQNNENIILNFDFQLFNKQGEKILLLKELSLCLESSEDHLMQIINGESIYVNADFFGLENNVEILRDSKNEKLIGDVFLSVFNHELKRISVIDLIEEYSNIKVTDYDVSESKLSLVEVFNDIDKLINRELRRVLYIPSIRGSIERSFNESSIIGNSLKKLQIEKRKDSEIVKDIEYWFDNFEIGKKNEIKKEKGKYEIKFDGINIADMGFGFNQVVPVIILSIMAKANGSNIVIIEEPESNLHPNLQSRLAEFFIFVNKKYGTQFIIETHSVSFITMMRFLVIDKQIDTSKIIINYVKKDLVKEIIISEDGALSGTFDDGFVNEVDETIEKIVSKRFLS